MDAEAARARLQAWRANGDDRLDPLRFGFLEAMLARAPAHAGRARELLDERLALGLDAYARALQRAAAGAGEPQETVPGSDGTLSGLIARMARPSADPGAGQDTALAGAPGAELPVLGQLRTVWAQLRTDSQLRQSMEQVPPDAGPLNSDMLVHRALQLMQAVSPGYLQHFIAYADTLASMQRLREAGTAPAGDAAAARKPARSRPRKRAG
ncbi:DUF2894 domain-containing protein [Pseudoxanthomonas sp. 10H]|uniref:DUF2894 domain-containing protein n=1 Tax=Pseudoxanthomonas sp. 10H TaxID=3242729 RepID=UPI003556E118